MTGERGLWDESESLDLMLSVLMPEGRTNDCKWTREVDSIGTVVRALLQSGPQV